MTDLPDIAPGLEAIRGAVEYLQRACLADFVDLASKRKDRNSELAVIPAQDRLYAAITAVGAQIADHYIGETARLRARVEVLERVHEAAKCISTSSWTGNPFPALRAALKEAEAQP